MRLADGFSLAEKFLTLSSGTARAQRSAGLPGGADVSQVVGTRLARLAPGDSATVAFAVLAAAALPQLQAAADAAAAAYGLLLPARGAAGAAGFAVYPNPSTGLLRVELPPGFGLTGLRVTNALGQVVLRLAATGGAVTVDLSGVSPGLYVLRAQGAGGALVKTLERR